MPEHKSSSSSSSSKTSRRSAPADQEDLQQRGSSSSKLSSSSSSSSSSSAENRSSKNKDSGSHKLLEEPSKDGSSSSSSSSKHSSSSSSKHHSSSKNSSSSKHHSSSKDSSSNDRNGCIGDDLSPPQEGSKATDRRNSSNNSSNNSNNSSNSSNSSSNSSNSSSNNSNSSSNNSNSSSSTLPAVTQATAESDSSSSDDDFGPKPAAGPQAAPQAKRRRLRCEKLLLEQLPSGDKYSKSFMHREQVTFVVASAAHQFLISGSSDGHIKFWIRKASDVEFVKHFRAHVGELHCLCISREDGGNYAASVGADKTLRVFDVCNFDMACLVSLDFMPWACEFVYQSQEPTPLVAVSDKETPRIDILKPLLHGSRAVLSFQLHAAPVRLLAHLGTTDMCFSADNAGGLELWTVQTGRRVTKQSHPTKVVFEFKAETHFFDLQRNETTALAIAASPNGLHLAVMGADNHLRVFNVSKGKLSRVYLETLQFYEMAQKDPQSVQLHQDLLDFEQRVALERELSRSPLRFQQSLTFDASSSFLLYPVLLGVKVLNILDNRVCRIIGRHEQGLRYLAVALHQPQSTRRAGRQADSSFDSVLVTSAFKKKRVYFFTPGAASDEILDTRDAFNEKPSKEEQESLTAASGASAIAPAQRLGKTATLHTTLGDIKVKLFASECPKTVENFTVHARSGYFDNLIFHRVIKGFMIQTGDPNGDGTGGESIWGGDFEDELHRALKHDRPFTLSMANAGPNTNGSQFFITTVPCPWLDLKHTVFGRVTHGADVVLKIEGVKTNQNDKPVQDVKLLTIKITS